MIGAIETERLRVIEITAGQFQLYIESIENFEQAMGLCPSGETLDDHLRQAMGWMHGKAVENPDKQQWYMPKMIILKKENRCIGNIGFHGPVKEDGTVEIGYGISEKYRGQGYATEALRQLCAWAMAQPGIREVTAETDDDNKASIKVLEKVGMTKTHAKENQLFWKLSK